MSDRRPPLGPIFNAFGVSCVVRPVGEFPIPATVILGTQAGEFPAGADLAIAEGLQLATFRRSEVATVSRGTLIEIGEKRLTVDGVLTTDDELVRVLVR